LSSLDACNIGLKAEFSEGYHTFLKTNCASCHTNGSSGNGAFADTDLDIAFEAFNVRGYNLVEGRALDASHQPPFTGSHHQAEIDQLDETWVAAKDQADLCIANAGISINPGIEDGVIDEDEEITEGTIETYLKLLSADKDARTITWDLENEIRDPSGLSIVGAELSIDVQALTTVTGEKSYVFSNPVIKTGDDPIHFQFISIKINNRLISEASSYFGVNRRVPANSTRRVGIGSMVFGFDVRSTDVVSLSIGRLDPINFNPPTYEDLAGASGIFNSSCFSCHGAVNPQASFDMTSYDNLINQIMVSPYSPNNSEIFKRMNDASNPMPQAGLLPQPQIDQVLQWIQDGATECGFEDNGNVRTNCP
jgi:mono/diheme cytochrome c family protein